MKMKKFTVLMLTMFMTVSMLSGCGNQEPAADEQAATNGADSTEDESAETGDDEELTEINLCYYLATSPNQEQEQKVEDAINAISEEAINVHVNIEPISMGAWDQQISLAISGGEQIDLMPTFFAGSTSLSAMHSTNQLMPLNDLLAEYGQDILSLTKEEYLETTTFEGNTLAVPIYRDIVSNIYFSMRKDVLDELGLLEQAEQISSMQDIEEIFKVVQAETDYIPLAPAGSSGVLNFAPALLSGEFSDITFYDQLVNTYAVAMDDDPYTVVNLYEQEEYKAAVELLEDWNNKGYIHPDATTTEDDNYTFINSGKCFSCFASAEEATASTTDAKCDYEMFTIRVCSLPLTTADVNRLNWIIPVTSKEPEAAMKFMNLMYTNEEIVNLFNYGIEGEDYIVQDDGILNYPEGVDYGSSKYHVDLTWLFGNQYIGKW